MPKLSQMRPQGIDQLGSLPHQKIARPMQHQTALLLCRFDLYKTHGRASHRLTDRLGVSGIILVALDVGLSHPSLASAVPGGQASVSRRAGFHANQASRQRLEELHHLAASQLLANDDLLGCVDRMNLKHVLSDIQTDRCNSACGGFPDVIRRATIILMGPALPGAGASTTSQPVLQPCKVRAAASVAWEVAVARAQMA